MSGGRRVCLIASMLLASGAAATARAGEPAACLSTDPTQWPAVHKPYVLVIASTGGSMGNAVLGASDSCGLGTTRRDHLRCTLRNVFSTYSGTVHFGLATLARVQTGTTCSTYANFPGESVTVGCGPEPSPNGDSSTRQGANIVVPIPADEVTQPPPPSNSSALLQWVDGSCSSAAELFANGTTGLNGPLRDAYRYFSNQWVRPDGTATFTTPLGPNDLACRKLHVVLITAADEGCDTQANAVDAAADLLAGFTLSGNRTFSVRTSVINFAGASLANMDAIAAAGGTGASFFATNENGLSLALSSIVGDLATPEVCDGADNDCNGCSDEGFPHFGNVGQDCCPWASDPQRTTCLNNYRASISPADPDGNPSLLPCTTAVQSQEPATWLCFNPLDVCDNVDNNLDGIVDEGQIKCGNPLHCPQPEACNGADDDCDGAIDEGCPGGPVANMPEICDGCDNDGDGIVDNGVASVSCGQPSPASCSGLLTCKPPQTAPFPGGCVAGGGFNACTFTPVGETCDAIDNDCNGIVDDGIAGVACEPPGTPSGLVYGGASQCRMGVQFCGQPCLGFIGPTPEVTDLIDNDCDGIAELDLIFTDGFETSI